MVNFKAFKKQLDDWFVKDDKTYLSGQCQMHNIVDSLDLNPIGNFLSHQTYNPETELFHTKYGKAFLLKSTPYVGIDESIVNGLYELLQSNLPVGACGQILLDADSKIGDLLDEYKAERSGAPDIFQEIAKSRAENAKSMSITPKTSDGLLFRDFNLYWSISIDDELGFSESDIVNIRKRVISALEAANCYPLVQSATDFLRLTSKILRPNDLPNMRDINWDPLTPINYQITEPSYLRNITSRRIIDCKSDWEIVTFRVKNYPLPAPEIWDMANAIGGMFDNSKIGCPFALSLIFKIADSSDLLKTADYSASQAEIRERERRGKSKSASEDVMLWREILSNRERGQRILLTNFQVSAFSKSQDTEKNLAVINSIFQSKMRWALERNDFLHMPMLLSHIPMNQNGALFDDLEKLGMIYKMWAMNAANIAPIIGEMKGSPSKKVLLVGRRGQLMFWDPFAHNRGNYNVAVVGGSGAGKSVFMQESVYAQLSTGGRVWVVDVGRSYYKMTQIFGGKFVVFNEKSDICLNPFYFANIETLDSFFKFMVGFIYTMAFPGDMAQQHEGWCKAVIDKVVHDVWYEFVGCDRRPDLQDIIDRLSQHEDQRARDMAVQLFTFGKKGVYGKYFNGVGKLDFDGSFIVFELEEVSQDKHLQSLIFILLINNVTEKMYLSDRKKRMSLVIDEAWDMLKGGHGADIIESIARRARKYNGNLWTGTQGVHDYAQSPAARAAWNNSYWQAMLSQDKSSITKAVQDGLLELDAFEERLIKDVKTSQGEYSEILLRGKSGEYAVGRLILDQFSKAAYSTQAAEYSRFNELLSCGNTPVQAIETIVSEFYGESI